MQSYIRPRCQQPGCENLAALVNNNTSTGIPEWRRWCRSCHSTRTAEKHGLRNLGEVIAKNAGFDSFTEYKNSTHPYRKFRKDYCENIDGRLGFNCNYSVVWAGILDVDHINGDPRDHREENLQTLCKNCHSIKTNVSKDYLTDGRKKLNIKY